MTIIKRADVGRPLTWDELDGNFRQVDELTASASAAVSSASASATAAATSATASANSATDAANSAANTATAIVSAVKSTVTFTTGGTLNSILDRISDGTYLYYWSGSFPVTVSAGSTVEGTGGIGPGFWAPDTELTLRNALKQNVGSVMIGGPGVNADLAAIPVNVISNHRVCTSGALTQWDGGSGWWIFDSSDLSAQVSTYPRLFVTPSSDVTGASGAWRLDAGTSIPAICYGVGLKGLDTSVDITGLDPATDRGEIFRRQANAAAVFNKETLEQLVAYNNTRKYIDLPPTIIYSSYYLFKVSPNFRGTFSTRTSSGTFFYTCIALKGSNDFFKVTSTTNSNASRVSGLYLRNISMAVYDFFSYPGGYDTFTDSRAPGVCYSFNWVGTQVDVDGLYAGGIEQAIKCNEVWDGAINNTRFLYCSNPTGSVSATWFGSEGTHNCNNLSVNHMHVEFSPNAHYVGATEHVRFNDCKFECWRQLDSTQPGVRIDATASRVTYNDPQFVTQNSTATHYIYNTGQFITVNNPRFNGGQSNLYPYPGIRWYKGASPTNTKNILNNITANRLYAADGSDSELYPFIFGNYTDFDGSFRTSDTYDTSTGTITTVNSGLMALGTQCHSSSVHLIVGSGAKTAGPVVYWKGDSARIDYMSQSAGNQIYRLCGGDSFNNTIGSFGTQHQSSSSSTIYTYGKRIIFLSAATSVSQLFGLVGDTITIISNVSGSTLVYGASTIVTTTGANVSMTAGRPYTLVMLSNGKAAQI